MAGGWFTVSYTVVERLHLFLFCQKFTSPPEDTLIPRGLNRLRRELFPSLFFFFFRGAPSSSREIWLNSGGVPETVMARSLPRETGLEASPPSTGHGS